MNFIITLKLTVWHKKMVFCFVFNLEYFEFSCELSQVFHRCKLRFKVSEILDNSQLFFTHPRNFSGGRQITLLFWQPSYNSNCGRPIKYPSYHLRASVVSRPEKEQYLLPMFLKLKRTNELI